MRRLEVRSLSTPKMDFEFSTLFCSFIFDFRISNFGFTIMGLPDSCLQEGRLGGVRVLSAPDDYKKNEMEIRIG